MKMKKFIVGAILFGLASFSHAIPTLQVYGVDSVAYDGGSDEDSWLVSSPTGSLELIGTYGPNTSSITNAFLVLTTAAHDGDLFAGFTKYDDASAFEASLETISDTRIQTNNHAPYGSNAAMIDTYALDLSILGFDSFDEVGPTKDCNADVAGATGCEAAPNSSGEIHTYNYDFTGLGLDWVHFDLVALVTDERGESRLSATWEINPGSHDTTWVTNVPEPGSLALLAFGLLGLGVVARRKS